MFVEVDVLHHRFEDRRHEACLMLADLGSECKVSVSADWDFPSAVSEHEETFKPSIDEVKT